MSERQDGEKGKRGGKEGGMEGGKEGHHVP